MDTKTSFESYAFLELMGHRKLAGLVQEVEIAGGKFLRIDVPDREGKLTTQFYSPSSIYCITPTTEAMVKAYAERNSAAPVHRYELNLVNEHKAETAADNDDDHEDFNPPV
jgi:hypothetical protein